jgi:hypothetical protein
VIARLAVRLAVSRQPGHRWRLLALPVTSAVAALLIAGAMGVVASTLRERDRVEARQGALSPSPTPRDLLVLQRTDDWQGEPIAVVWLEAASAAVPVLPPGVDRFPPPGRAVVSPALAELARREPALSGRYRDHDVLAAPGIADRGELLAYVRPPRGTTIAANGSTVRITAFGRDAGAGVVGIADGGGTDPRALVSGALAFLVIPAGLMLLGGVATASRARDHRHAVLRALGARQTTLVILTAGETAFLALAGAAVGAAVAWAASPALDAVPLTGHRLMPGDFQAPFAAYPALAVLVAWAAAALATAILPFSRQVRAPRNAGARRGTRAWRLIPLGLAIGAALGGVAVGGTTGGTMLLAGMVASLAALPLASPGVLPGLGAAMASSRSVAGLIAGRRLQAEPVRIGRPFAAYGVLVLLSVLTGCYVALLDRGGDETPVQSGPAAVLVRWSDAPARTVDRLARALPGATVVPVDESERGVRVRARCRDLQDAIRSLDCDVGPRSRASVLEEALLLEPGGVAFRDGDAASPRPNAAIAIAGGRLTALDRRVRNAASGLVAAPSLSSRLDARRRPSPLTPWLRAGLAVAGLTLALAGLVLLVDTVLRARAHRGMLEAVGMRPEQVARLEALLFALPFGGVAAVSLLVGLVFAALFVRVAGVPFPLAWILATVGTVGAGGLLASLAVAIGAGVSRRAPG